MEFGINLAPSADSWKIVKRAEELGFDAAWFIDSQLINADLFVAMTAAAVATKKIKLGTGMLIPSNRVAPVAANALASLNKLAPGRIQFGVATGFTARRSMGLAPVRLAEFKEYVRVVLALLRGETVEWESEGKRRKIRFLNPELGQIDLDHPIALHISAMGPKIRSFAAELGAGFVMPVASVAAGEAAIAAIHAAWREAGRDEASLQVTAVGNGCVLAPGEPYDSARAKAQAGPGAAIVLHDLVERPLRGSSGHAVSDEIAARVEAFRPIYEAYDPPDARYLSAHRGHLMILRPEEEKLIDAELIRRLTMTGTLPEMRARLRALRDMGFTRFSTHIRYGQPQMLEDWAEVIAGV